MLTGIIIMFYVALAQIYLVIGLADYYVYKGLDKKTAKRGAIMALFCWAWPILLLITVFKSLPELIKTAFSKE